jgi:hypothetical protein
MLSGSVTLEKSLLPQPSASDTNNFDKMDGNIQNDPSRLHLYLFSLEYQLTPQVVKKFLAIYRT